MAIQLILFKKKLLGMQADTDLLSQSEEPRLPQINIGVNHQADIPELYNDRIDLHRVPEQLLWDPGINDGLDDNEGIQTLANYIQFILSILSTCM